MTKKKIHKRVCDCRVIVGAITKCGLLEFNIDDECLSWRWNKVTCKNCLKLKEKKK